MNAEEQNSTNPYKPGKWGVRHIQAILLFIFTFVGMGSRIELSVAIVAMTDNTTSSNPDVPTYDWTNKSIILSSFYWGYILLQVVAGSLSEKISVKIYLLVSVGANALICLLIPLMAEHFGSTGVMICRIFQGVAQSGFFPCLYVLLGRWVPPAERSRLSAIAGGGAAISPVLTLPVVGFLSSTAMGWPSAFYLFGVLNAVWVGLFFMFGADYPRTHPRISNEEKVYIETSLKTFDDEDHILPVKQILTSAPFWALNILSVACNWGWATLSNEMPNYMNKVMKYDINSNGFVSSLPSTASFFSTFVFAILADYLINRKYLTRTATRKIFAGFGNITSASCLLVIAFLPNNRNVLTIVLFVLSSVLGSANAGGGSVVNFIDLSPKFSGFIMSIINTLAQIVGMTGPLAVQFVVQDETNKSQWGIIFIIMSVASITGAVVYCFLASGDLQWWNFYGPNVKSREDLEKLQNKIEEKSPKVESDFI